MSETPSDIQSDDASAEGRPARAGSTAPNRWWLIADDVVDWLRANLDWEESSKYCECDSYGPKLECPSCTDSTSRKALLHELDSGLHRTDAVPADWAP